MNHLIEPLKNLGLSEKEVLVYLALLQLGSATPYQIAIKSGIKRPTTYVITEDLVKKGLIIHITGEVSKLYMAKMPDTYIEERKKQLATAEDILPELRSYQKNTAEKPSILYFEGVDGLRQAYQYKQKELHDTEIVGFFSSNEDASPAVTQVFMEWNEYKEQHKTRVRGLTVDTPTLKPFAKFIGKGKYTIDAKFLPQDIYSSKVSIESCDNQFVRICLMDSVETLIIESPKLALAIKEVFELLWKSLGNKYDKPKTWENKKPTISLD